MATVRIEKNKFKIICAAVMCTFSLIVTVTGVLAWFSAQTHVNNESNNFTVLQTDSAVNSISVNLDLIQLLIIQLLGVIIMEMLAKVLFQSELIQ